MKIWMLAGAACAALTGVAVPASAAISPGIPTSAHAFPASADQAVDAFYALRRGAPLWLRSADSSAAREMIEILQRAPLDGLASGPALAAEAQSLLARAQSGDAAALARAERLLSTAWVLYVQALETPPAGMTYADSWVAPRRHTPGQILAAAAAAPSLANHVRTTSDVNPLYAQLRDAAWAQGATSDPRVAANLERLRTKPFQKRYVVVDAAAARLYMIEDGRIADSMKVIVGKPTSQTPMLASTIYRATLNPYWNVPGDMVRSLIAPRVLEQGVGYLKAHSYEVLSDYSADATPVSPEKVDWRAVADGTATIKVRQRPGPGNSMGQVKFSFPNGGDIFLHDTPKKELFAQASRDLSNGCIRLEDAARLGRWLMGREPTTASNHPEQHVLLPTPTPIYVTYVTAQANGGQLSFVDDVYGLDSQRLSQVAALR
jgi:murein L,D-transpeptidase YcbB/YkuD